MLTGTSSHGGGGGTSPDVAALPPFDTSDRSETRGGGRGAAEERGERVEDRRTVEEVEERVEEIGCTRREKKNLYGERIMINKCLFLVQISLNLPLRCPQRH